VWCVVRGGVVRMNKVDCSYLPHYIPSPEKARPLSNTSVSFRFEVESEANLGPSYDKQFQQGLDR
jgi:hypothetical protein